MSSELIRMTAVEAVKRLKAREITPLELIDASATRIAEVEPAVNALPTLCLDRAREHAKRIMSGAACEAAGEAGWLAGLPVSIKDLTDVAGVRTTYGSPIFADHVPTKSHPVVERIERKGGIVIAKSNTPEFGAGGSTFNEVFGRTRNPWNTSLTCGGSTGGGAVSLATGEVWLAHGTDHGGSLRRPGTYCSVVGLRPSPGRVTRGTVEQPVLAALGAGADGAQRRRPGAVPRHHGGPLPARPDDLRRARTSRSATPWREPIVRRSASPSPPTSTARCRSTARSARSAPRMARRFEELGCIVEEASPDLGNIDEAFLDLRSQHFVVDRELQLRAAIATRSSPTSSGTPSAACSRRRRAARLGRARARRPVPAHGRVLRRNTTCW